MSTCSQTTKLVIKKIFVFLFVSAEAKGLQWRLSKTALALLRKWIGTTNLALRLEKLVFCVETKRILSLKLITCCIFNTARFLQRRLKEFVLSEIKLLTD